MGMEIDSIDNGGRFSRKETRRAALHSSRITFLTLISDIKYGQKGPFILSNVPSYGHEARKAKSGE